MLAPRRRTPEWWRRLRLDVRDTLVLLREFRWPLLAMVAAIAIGGSLYHSLSELAGEPVPGGLVGGWYFALAMMFLAANLAFPQTWYLQVFFFTMPVLGLAILSRGIADFGVLLFNRQARGEAWQVAVAQTYKNHIVLIGLGHLGFRVARALKDLGEPFVCVQLDPTAELVSAVSAWNVPIIAGDARQPDVLERAGVAQARTVVLATSNDQMNLQIAINARAVNPQVRTIVRLFDDAFAREMCQAFGITNAFSASALAAPAFAAAAADLSVVQQITVEGRVLNLGTVTLGLSSPLIERTISQVEGDLDLSIVLHRRGRTSDLHPKNELRLAAGDELSVFADVTTLQRLRDLAH
jgi:Trk K+ transport system NAD-binding subunit